MKSKFKVADVLELEHDQLSKLAPTSWHLRTLHAIRRCRTQSMGGHIDQCDCCNKLHISYNCCRNRHCPTCQGQKHDITLKISDFIKRFALHILPKGFTRIRHFGILSSSWKKVKLPELQKLLNERKTLEIITENPTHHRRCPTCKKGKLITVLLFDGRGPPENWKKIINSKKSIK